MSHNPRGLIFIINERQDEWRRQAAEDRRAMYARPDVAATESLADDASVATWRRPSLTGLRRLIGGSSAEA